MVVLRLRALGWLPWLGLAAWGVLAAALEPPVLRSSGVRLREAACWSAAVVIWWVSVTTSPDAAPSRWSVRLGAHLIWLATVGVGVGLLGVALGFEPSIARGALAGLAQWGWFVCALSPLAVAVSGVTQIHARYGLMAILAMPSAVAIPGLWLAPEAIAPLTASCLLSLAAAILAVFASSSGARGASAAGAPRGSLHENRHSR